MARAGGAFVKVCRVKNYVFWLDIFSISIRMLGS